MKPYSLRLVTQVKPDTPEEIYNSNQMIAYGIWSEYVKLPHVDLSYQNDNDYYTNTADEWIQQIADLPSVDFTLVHSFFSSPVFTRNQIEVLKSKTRMQFMWMSEMATSGFDYQFTWLPYPENRCLTAGGHEQIEFPILRDVLMDSMQGAIKIKGSCFIDHNHIQEDPSYPIPDWSSRIHEWLEPYKESRKVTQQCRDWSLRGYPRPVFPDWVEVVPEQKYTNYLKLTSSYEYFIQTHPGAYEHSILDMESRGIKVLVPVDNGVTFIPQSTIEKMGIKTFSNREEFMALLNSPEGSWKIDRCTDMPQVVQQIDAHCQSLL